MSYRPLEYSHIQHPTLIKILLHSDMLLHDLHNIFELSFESTSSGGAGNFSIAVVLLCVVDGLAVYLYPTTQVDNQEKRFKKLIREKLYWGPTKKGWVEQGLAAKQFYLEMRNPLVHELGADITTSARIARHSEPRIGKWGSIPEGFRDIKQIQSMDKWNDDWPILAISKDERGREFVKFSGAAMYWAVKKMIIELINDKFIIEHAITCLDEQSSHLCLRKPGWVTRVRRKLCRFKIENL